ncbi:hypothetical protein Acid7E03_28980 [Acidisoma sp. 7E03]
MDDILASIRRIMLDEQARLKEGAPAAQPLQHEEESGGPAQVILLDESMAIREPEPVTAPAVEAEPMPPAAAELMPGAPSPGPGVPVDAVFLETLEVTPEPAPLSAPIDEPVSMVHSAQSEEAEGKDAGEKAALPPLDAQALEALLAPAAAAAATASVEAMLRQLQAEREAFVQTGAGGGPSLEEVVRSELRPMLKSWLDAHLADMVERLVRAELARLTLRHGS